MRTVTRGEFEGGSVFIDGDWKPLSEAKVSMFDWGFTRSDVTYDVASAWKGAFFRLDDHLDRFFASLDKLRMKIPYSRAEVRQILHGCVRAGGLDDAYVAMVCTRGVPPRGARDPRLATQSLLRLRAALRLDRPAREAGPGHRPARQPADPDRARVGRSDDQELPLDGPGALDVRRLRPRRRHQLRRRCPGQHRRRPGLQRLHGQGRRRAHRRSRRARGHLAQDGDRAVRRARHPAAGRAGAGGGARRAPTRSSSAPPAAACCRSPRSTAGRSPPWPGPITRRLHDAYWALHDDPRHRDPIER